jgi:hypothetical protein
MSTVPSATLVRDSPGAPVHPTGARPPFLSLPGLRSLALRWRTWAQRTLTDAELNPRETRHSGMAVEV